MKVREFVSPLLIVLLLTSFAMAQLPEQYTSYNEALQIMTDLQADNPGICLLDTMGYSTRDSVPMLRFKISDNVEIDEDEPAVFYCGGVHADEVLGAEVVINFLQDFIQEYNDENPDVIRFTNNLELFCIPFINPEGHIVVEDSTTLWRKNKSDNDNNGIFNFHDGVDNNRNYDFGWSIDDGIGATTPESLMFKGFSPFSESENIAMADFGWKYRPIVALDYHSPTYGRPNVAYYPWYWYSNQGGHGFGPDEDLMYSISNTFTSLIEAIPDDSGNGTYTARRALVNKGDFKTYFYGNFGSVSFSVEVSDTTIQDVALLDTIVTAHLPGQYYLLDRALGSRITGVIKDSVTLEPLEAEVQVTQHINADLNPRLSRPDFGRYNRILASGSYTLKFLKDGYVTQTINNVVVPNGQPVETNVLLVPLNPTPPAPSLINPAPDTVLNETTVQFDWTESPYAEIYLFELYFDELMTMPVVIDSAISDTGFVVESMMMDSDYYWRTKGGNATGWGPYTDLSHFSIAEPSGVDDNSLPETFSLKQNYPNPFNPSTEISYTLAVDAEVSLKIYNVLGREVAELSHGHRNAGEHSVTWDASGQPSGIYFARLSSIDKSESISMILLK